MSAWVWTCSGCGEQFHGWTKEEAEQKFISHAREMHKPNLRITKDGQVFVGDRDAGWVDHYDPTKRNRVARTWRGIREGGHSKSGFKTRAAAAEWVVNS